LKIRAKYEGKKIGAVSRNYCLRRTNLQVPELEMQRPVQLSSDKQYVSYLELVDDSGLIANLAGQYSGRTDQLASVRDFSTTPSRLSRVKSSASLLATILDK
jgi:hypothetical protein